MLLLADKRLYRSFTGCIYGQLKTFPYTSEEKLVMVPKLAQGWKISTKKELNTQTKERF